MNIFEGPILYCFSSISHSCQRSNNTVFDIHCPKRMRGLEFQQFKSRSIELYSERSVCLHLYLESPACYVTLRERMPLALAVSMR